MSIISYIIYLVHATYHNSHARAAAIYLRRRQHYVILIYFISLLIDISLLIMLIYIEVLEVRDARADAAYREEATCLRD